jgi:hypothetical protein
MSHPVTIEWLGYYAGVSLKVDWPPAGLLIMECNWMQYDRKVLMDLYPQVSRI